MAMIPMLELYNITLGYAGLTLFRDLSLSITRGTTLAVLGSNGAGKSTFAKMLLGLHHPTKGHLRWHASKPPSQIGYLAQMGAFDRYFPIRVRDLAAMGAWKNFGLMGRLDRQTALKVHTALELTGIVDIADRSLHAISGGQLQRALFARLIVQDAPLIILDEPFAAIDQTTEAHLLGLIDHWRDEGRALVLIVHDLSSVLDHCQHALLLGAGQASYGRIDDVLTTPKLVAQNYLSPMQAEWMFARRVQA